MAIIHMVAPRNMCSALVRTKVFSLALLLMSATDVVAVNYGAGLYNANLYSASTPDTTAPILSSGSPSGILASGTTSTSLSVTTNESATCRYSTSANTLYASMTTTFETTGATTHTTSVSALQNNTSYSYYVRCSDLSSNSTVTDYIISFSVANRSSVISSGSIPVAYISNTSTRPSDCLPTYTFSPSTGRACTSNTIPTTPSTSSISPYTRDLKLGMIGEDVKALQAYLNTHGFPVTTTGLGSKGLETTKFGSLTQKALIKFQIANKITPAAGYFGIKTRAAVGARP